MLIGFRANRTYSQFWEGITLVQMMRAEWFESASTLMAFCKVAIMKDPDNTELQERKLEFQALLVRLMSLMHGSALRQIGGNVEEFEVIDLYALDDESLMYLGLCEAREVNVVEVVLHWITVLITDNATTGIIAIAPPILSRSYQTLSRGMVNLHDARKLADVPYPFPLSQIHVLLIWLHMFLTPIVVAKVVPNDIAAACVCAVPIAGMWCITFIAGQFEQPFGDEANDLPLSTMQFEFNTSLLMLLDPQSIRAPHLKDDAARSVWELRSILGDPDSTTAQEDILSRIPPDDPVRHSIAPG